MKKLFMLTVLCSIMSSSFVYANPILEGTTVEKDTVIVSEAETGSIFKMPRMTIFASSLYTEGTQVKSLINFDKDIMTTSSNCSFITAGKYVTAGQAGVKDGNDSAYSKVIYNGMTTASIFNNPLEANGKDNTFWVK